MKSIKSIGATTSNSDLTMREVMPLFFDSPEFRNLKPASQKTYEQYSQIIAKVPGKISQLTHEKIERVLPTSPGAYRRARSCIRRISAWAGSPARHCCTAASLKKTARPTPEAARAALAGTKADGELNAAIALVYYTAQRLVDCVRLSADDIVVIRGNRHFKVTQSKTGTTVYPPICEELESYLPKTDGRYIKASAQTIRSRWTRAAKGLGLDGLTIHGFRKAALCEAAEGGATMPEIQAQGGHKSLKSAAEYLEGADKSLLAASAFAKRGGYIS